MLGTLRATAGGSATPIVNTSQAITAASTIAIVSGVANQVCPVTSAAAITLTGNPQLGTGIAGQRVTIQNAGSFTITFTDGNGLSLQGTLAIGSTQFATFVNLGGFWQLEDTNGSPVWVPFTFQNGFANLAGFQTCEYTRFRNVVELRGHASRTGAATSGTAIQIATLPIGFRPPSNPQRFATEAATPGFGVAASVQIGNDGGVLYLAVASTMPGTQFVAFNGTQFRV